MIRDNPTRWNSAYKMLQRAVYLRRAIEKFIDDVPKLRTFKLTKMEWDQAEFLLNILLPLHACSSRLEGTVRPGIAKVFWVYESLFNELDRLSDIMSNPRNAQHQWMIALKPALDALTSKLRKHYSATDQTWYRAEPSRARGMARFGSGIPHRAGALLGSGWLGSARLGMARASIR